MASTGCFFHNRRAIRLSSRRANRQSSRSTRFVRTSDSLKKMDIRFAHDENTSGRHIFETNVNRFALLILQVHGAKPIDDLTQQASIRQGQTGAIDPVDNL